MGLDEVVVTALGISREKKAVGYAVQDVNNEVIERAGNTDLAGAMQGKISGIDIKPSSGMPGASSQIVIRGARSFTGNNAPLYVVDGMPISSNADIQSGSGGDFSSAGYGISGSDISNRAVDLNPSDIESITILKGQAAAALYVIALQMVLLLLQQRAEKIIQSGSVISISHISSFSKVSRIRIIRQPYAQGLHALCMECFFIMGTKNSGSSDDPAYGGNANGHPGKFYVPQLELGMLKPGLLRRCIITGKIFQNRLFRNR
jgi:hypothetical protein